MGGDAYCTLNILESICQRVSVLVACSSRSLSSCNEAQLYGCIGNNLSSAWSVCQSFGQSRLRRGLDLTPFFPCSKHVVGSRSVFDDGSGTRTQWPVLSWGVASLFVSAPELQSWHRYPSSPCKLWSMIWSWFSLLVVFLRVISIIAHPAIVDCLLKSHHPDTAGDMTMGASAFSLRKNAYMQNHNLHLYHTC